MVDVKVWLPAVSLCVLLLINSAGNVGAAVVESDEDRYSHGADMEALMVGIPGVASSDFVGSQLLALGVEVLEYYDAMVLASVSVSDRALLEILGFDVIDQPLSTFTGRGAYFFDTRNGEPAIGKELRVEPSKVSEYNIHIVQFIGPVKSEWVETIWWMGAEVFDYLPSFSFIISADPDVLMKIVKLPFVRWTGPYHPAYKLSPSLDSVAEESVEIVMSLFPGRSADDAVAEVELAGGEILSTWYLDLSARIKAVVPAVAIVQIAQLPEVSWIQESATYFLCNDQASWVLQSNTLDMRPIFARGITGTGQLVTVADSGVDLAHEMFLDPQGDPVGANHRKIAEYYVPTGSLGVLGDELGHGTHVTGTVLGDAPEDVGGMAVYGTYSEYDGQAFGARAILQDLNGASFGPPSDLNNLFQPSYDSGSRIHTNSWGGWTETYGPRAYDLNSETIDAFMWNHPDYLILFAAGNFGPDIGFLKPCEANSKNTVVVGAAGNGPIMENLAIGHDSTYFSSRGAAGDGRLKPTLVAPGQDIMSALNGDPDGYTSMDGTSMATPGVAGAAALVRQYFVDGWYPGGTALSSSGFSPPASLVKAILVNSAGEISGLEAYGQTSVNTYSIVELSTSAAAAGDTPYGLRVMKTAYDNLDNVNTHPVRAVSPMVPLDYSDDYRLALKFKVVDDTKSLVLVDDGRARIEVTGADMYVFGQSVPQPVLISQGVYYDLEVFYYPSSGTYDVKLNGQNVATGIGFVGEPEYQLAVGSGLEVGSRHFGELYFDAVMYTGVTGTPVYFHEDFNDGEFYDWILWAGPTKELRYPNNHQGWGLVNLDNALYFAGDSRRLVVETSAGLSTGGVAEYMVLVSDSSEPFETTLVWTDYKGTAGTKRAIVNNIDLEVRDPSGNVYYGNVFSGYNHAQSSTGGSRDSLNLEETVLRFTPSVGWWSVKVIGSDIPVGPQPFSLVMTGSVYSADQALPMFDDFNNGLDSNWCIEDSGGTVGIYDDPKMSPCLEVTKDGSSGISWAKRHFNPQYGNLVAEAWVNAVECSNCAYFILYDSATSACTVTFAYYGGWFRWFNESVGWQDIMDADPNRWYLIRFDVDMANGTYDIYIDEAKVKDDALLRGTSPHCVDSVYFQAGWPDGYYSIVTMRIDDVKAFVPTTPDAPTSLQGVPGSSGVTLSWSAPLVDGGSPITGYVVYRSVLGAPSLEAIASLDAGTLTYLDESVELGTTYVYGVKAANRIGEGAMSSTTQVTTWDLPSAPQSLAATPGDTQIYLHWSVPASDGGSQITSYRVYRSTDAITYSLRATVPQEAGSAPVTEYLDTGLVNGQRYYYKVSAVTWDEGPMSNMASAVPAGLPSPPRNLGAFYASGSGYVYVSWGLPLSNGGSPITHYNIYRAIKTGQGIQYEYYASSLYTVFHDYDVQKGKTYYYYVTAVNAIGESLPSNEVSVKIK